MDPLTILSHVPFTTSGSLVDCIDKKVLVVLRDGKRHLGVLRSYDQFANLLLENIQLHCFDLIRGENVVLLGEIDLDKEDDVPLDAMIGRSADTKVAIQQEKRKAEILRTQFGFSAEGQEGDTY